MSDGWLPVSTAEDKPEPPPSRLGDDGGPASEAERHDDGSYNAGSGSAPDSPGAVLAEAFAGEADGATGQDPSPDEPEEDGEGEPEADEGAADDEPEGEPTDFADSDEASSDEPGADDDVSSDDGAADDEPGADDDVSSDDGAADDEPGPDPADGTDSADSTDSTEADSGGDDFGAATTE